MDWTPTLTRAPRDGTAIIMFRHGIYFLASYADGVWVDARSKSPIGDDDACGASHWAEISTPYAMATLTEDALAEAQAWADGVWGVKPIAAPADVPVVVEIK